MFVSRLMAGEALGVSTAAAFNDYPEFDLTANITGVIEAGVFTAASHGD